MQRPLALAALGAALLGCGGGETTTGTTTGAGGSSGSSGTTGAGGGSSAVKCDSAPATLSLEGTWAVKGRLAVKLKGAPGGAITICPTDQPGEASILMMVTIQQDPADATKLTGVKATLCSIDLPTVSALVGSCDPTSMSLVYATMSAPQKLIDALPKVVTTAVGGKLDSAASGSAIALERFTVTVGSTKGGDLLPKWDTKGGACNSTLLGHTNACEATCVDDCASLRDDDGDGFPGVTIDVCGLTASDQKNSVPCHVDHPDDPGATLQGKAFLDIQVDPQFSGTAKSSCELTGSVDAATEIRYQILGTDIWLAGSALGVDQTIGSLPSFQVDSAASKFRMVRVDGKYGAPDWKIDPLQPSPACAAIDQRVNEL
ncbi:MAG: hypothetical protein ABJE95_27170 [Byssovorax sp.]